MTGWPVRRAKPAAMQGHPRRLHTNDAGSQPTPARTKKAFLCRNVFENFAKLSLHALRAMRAASSSSD